MQNGIATALEEQTAATQEMSRSVAEAAQRASDFAHDVTAAAVGAR
jgi:methyl-accepting chemotaxis protein